MAAQKKLTPAKQETAEPYSQTAALEARVQELEAKVATLMAHLFSNVRWVSK